MDPNETLTQIREALSEYHEGLEAGDGWLDALQTIAELFENLDRWLSLGGFKPREWGGYES